MQDFLVHITDRFGNSGTHTYAGVSSAAAAAGSAGATAAGSSAAGSTGAAASGTGSATGSSGPGSPAAATPSCGNFDGDGACKGDLDGDGALDGEQRASEEVSPPTGAQSSSPPFEDIAGSAGAESDVLSGLPPVVAPARFPPSVGSVEVLLTRVGC